MFGLKNCCSGGERERVDQQSKVEAVDPDIFKHFTPIPYHNNKELTYLFASVRMRNHVNRNSINPETYAWKGYHNSYDHDNKNTCTTGPLIKDLEIEAVDLFV